MQTVGCLVKMERERRQGRPLGRGWRFYIPAPKNALQGLVGALEGRNIKYYPFTLDRVTRNTLCSGAAALMGGGSCLLLGERRKLGGVQGALSRAALVAPAGAKLPLLQGCCLGAWNGPGGYHDTPLGRSVFQECDFAANPYGTRD